MSTNLYDLLRAGQNGFLQAFKDAKSTIDGTFVKDAYLKCRDFVQPWNRIHLRKLDRAWSDCDIRMEEAIFTLLCEFFDGEQPFHVMSGRPYDPRHVIEKDISIHYDCLRSIYKEEPENPTFAIYHELLDIMHWYRDGGLEFRGEDAFTKHYDKGAKEALRIQREVDEEIDRKLLFIVKHRGWLWT